MSYETDNISLERANTTSTVFDSGVVTENTTNSYANLFYPYVLDHGGNDEIVINNKTGYIVNTRVELFTKCIYLYRNDTLRLRFSKQAIIYCDKNFSKALHLNRLLEIYRSFE